MKTVSFEEDGGCVEGETQPRISPEKSFASVLEDDAVGTMSGDETPVRARNADDDGKSWAPENSPPSAGDASAEGAGEAHGPRRQTSFAKPSASDRVTAAAASAAAFSAAMAKTMDKINRKVCDAPVVKVIAETLGVKPMVVAMAGVLSIVGFLLFGLGGQLVCMVAGGLYPAFESFKVIESGDAKSMEFWLTYWVVFATITAVEHVGYYVLVWLPFYYPMKLGLLLWLCSPTSGGAKYLYRWFVSPPLIKHRDLIDEVLDASSTKLRSGVKGVVNGAVSMSMDTAKGAGAEGMKRLRRGLSFVRPGMGTIATVCFETAVAAASKGRSQAGVAAAKVFGSTPAKQSEDEVPLEPRAAQEPSDEPAAEPPTSGRSPAEEDDASGDVAPPAETAESAGDRQAALAMDNVTKGVDNFEDVVASPAPLAGEPEKE